MSGILKLRFQPWCLLIACLSAVACTTTKENEGPASYYQPIGWQGVKDTLKPDDFNTYQSAITERVRSHRFIINTDDAVAEVTLASPAEFVPNGPSCLTDAPKGIFTGYLTQRFRCVTWRYRLHHIVM